MTAVLYAIVYGAGWSGLRRAGGAPRATAGGLILLGLVAVPSLMQFPFPRLLEIGSRSVPDVMDGAWWRLLTSMVFQDGGWPGTAFNLVTLAVSIMLVGAVLRGPQLLGVFVVGGLLSNIIATFLLRQSGAGNSMATMCLVAVALVIVWRRTSGGAVQLVIVIGVAITLVIRGDQHGFAVVLGILIGSCRTNRLREDAR